MNAAPRPAQFAPQQATSAYAKLMLFGSQGSGKTYTATSIAIGLVEHLRALGLKEGAGPIYFLDTEKGSDWIAGRVRDAKIDLLVSKTRSFADLKNALIEAEQQASVLIIDSLTHYWVELCDTFREEKKRKRGLEMYDWQELKKIWRDGFSEPFINSNLHIIACGRAGFEYEHYEDDSGKKQIERGAVKMKAEAEVAYEADLLVYMEHVQDETRDSATGRTRRITHHVAQVLKDRSTLIEGKAFEEPTFADFLPHINKLNLGGAQIGVDTTRTSAALIAHDAERDQSKRRRKIVLEQVEALLVSKYPSTSGADKKAKIDAVGKHFGTTSWTEIEELMTFLDIQRGFDGLHREILGGPSRYGHLFETQQPIAATATPVQAPMDELDRVIEAARAPALPAPQSAAVAPLSETVAPSASASLTADSDPALADADYEANAARDLDDQDIIAMGIITVLNGFRGNPTRAAGVMKSQAKRIAELDERRRQLVDDAYAKACRKPKSRLAA